MPLEFLCRGDTIGNIPSAAKPDHKGVAGFPTEGDIHVPCLSGAVKPLILETSAERLLLQSTLDHQLERIEYLIARYRVVSIF